MPCLILHMLILVIPQTDTRKCSHARSKLWPPCNGEAPYSEVQMWLADNKWGIDVFWHSLTHVMCPYQLSFIYYICYKVAQKPVIWFPHLILIHVSCLSVCCNLSQCNREWAAEGPGLHICWQLILCSTRKWSANKSISDFTISNCFSECHIDSIALLQFTVTSSPILLSLESLELWVVWMNNVAEIELDYNFAEWRFSAALCCVWWKHWPCWLAERNIWLGCASEDKGDVRLMHSS